MKRRTKHGTGGLVARLFLALSTVGLVATATIGTRDAYSQDAASPEHKALLAELGALPYRILFERYEGNNWEIYSMKADGSDVVNLTNTPRVHELYPQASPDGTKISFLVDVPKDNDTLRSVYYMNADGTGRTLIAEKARQPCWSPDSGTVAFLKQEFSRLNIKDFVSKGLFFYDLKTGKITEHRNNNHADVAKRIHHLYNPTWAANGKWIVSTVHGGMGHGHAILAIEVQGDRVVNLQIPGCRPCLSPDGTQITWSPGDHAINVADIDYSGAEPRVRNIQVVDKREKLHLYHPDFSPDGKYITYSVGPGGRMPANGPGTHTEVAEMVGVRGKWNIYLRRSTGKGPILRLTSDESKSNKESEWLPASRK